MTSTTIKIAPNTNEYLQLSNLAYSLTDSNGNQVNAKNLVLPPGFTFLAQSLAVDLAQGFSAIAVRDPLGNVIIVNEGTAVSLHTALSHLPFVASDIYGNSSVAADTAIANGKTPTALIDAIAFAVNIQKAYGSFYVTGHSLGGIEAEEEAKTCGANCLAGATFGATGLPQNNGSTGNNLNVIDYVDYGDTVGNLGSDISNSSFL